MKDFLLSSEICIEGEREYKKKMKNYSQND